MSHIWPSETVFDRVDLFLDGQGCNFCETALDMWGHRKRRVFTLHGPQLLVVRLGHCPDPGCPGCHQSVGSWGEMAIAPPRLTVAWDVFAWIGHRRFARHWCVPQICGELSDSQQIYLSEDAIEDYIRRYETMVAARQGDLKELRKVYTPQKSLILSIDGIQPEKGHETLYVVRELTQKRVWFAEPLLSSTNDEVRRLLLRAKNIADTLDRPVAGWMSDKQDAFVQGIATVFPGTPHGYCKNHFLRDLAKPLLEADSHAKVQMRRKVRGLRSIEQAVLRERAKTAVLEGEQRTETLPASPPGVAETAVAAPPAVAEVAAEDQGGYAAAITSTLEETAAKPSPAGQVVLDYCAAVRGILTDDQGGPLHPPGLRMADALQEVRQSLDRCIGAKKGGPQRSSCSV
jgi:hypothetical protein